MVKLAHGILTVAHTTYRTRECLTVDFINGQCGSHLQGILQRRTIHAVWIRELCILAYADDAIKLVAAIETGREVLEVGILQHTQSLLITNREELCGLFAGLWESNIVVLSDTSTSDLVYPVGIAVRHRLFGIHKAVVVASYSVSLHGACGRIVYRKGGATIYSQRQTVVLGIVVWVLAVVKGSLNQSCCILLAVEKLHLLGHPRSRNWSIEVDIDLVALLSLLSGNNDYTIGSAWSVNRGGCCILQHLHSLNVVGVQVVERTAVRHTVYDIKRCCAWTTHRADTTDMNISLTWRRTITSNGHARHLTLQWRHWVRVATLEVLGLYYTYRTCQVGLTLNLITGYHDFW